MGNGAAQHGEYLFEWWESVLILSDRLYHLLDGFQKF
jgi:hypothetical protein